MITNELLRAMVGHANGLINSKMDADCSLYNGACGLAIYSFYMGRELNDNAMLETGHRLLQATRSKLETGDINFRIFHSLSYGLAGIAYTYWHLQQFLGLPLDAEGSFNDIEPMLVASCAVDFDNNISDNLHGPLGVLYYLSKLPSTPSTASAIKEIVDMFSAKVVTDAYGLRIRNTMVKETHEREFNLSMSHGLSGNLSILADIYAKNICKAEISMIIEQGVKYIEFVETDVIEPGVTNSYFPAFVSELDGINKQANKSNYTTRLGWCYGDLNMAFLFLRLGRAFSRNDYWEKGIRIAERTLARTSRQDAQVSDIYFCHGSCGLAYLYLKLYELTSEPQFLKQSEHWLELTNIRILDSIKNETTAAPLSFLDGFPSTILAYSACLNQKSGTWDDVLFLNF